MNEQKIAILVDSGTDVPMELQKKYGMYSVPLKVIFSDGEYRDGIDITAAEVYRRLPQEIPKTSLPDGASILETFDQIRAAGYEKVIAITISSGLSGTYNMIQLLSHDYQGLTFYCLDTKNISIGSGFFAIRAAELLAEGADWDTIKIQLNRTLDHSKVFFCLETLEYLQKGGRIGLVTAVFGNALNLKPIISCNPEGVYYTMAKIRGRHNSLEKMLELAHQYAASSKRYQLALIGSGEEGLREAAELRSRLLDLLGNHTLFIEAELGSGLGVHVGPGLVGIGVFLLDE